MPDLAPVGLDSDSQEGVTDVESGGAEIEEASSSTDVFDSKARWPRFSVPKGKFSWLPKNVTPSVLDEDWSDYYEKCPVFSEIWKKCLEGADPWPPNVKLFRGKIYRSERLCVPTGLAMTIVGAQHIFGGHLGVAKLVNSLQLRYEFAETRSLWSMAKEMKNQCNTCAACEHPNWKISGKIEMTPIPPKIMTSVSMDLFSPPPTTWQGISYDALVLCVDRHSGWIIAIPTQKFGLTAEKLGHLMMDNGWNLFGVPSIITSDQGPQFSGAWWRTICGRLGIRTAYSQAHKPQSNGRAEVAGKQFYNILRKLHTEMHVNWVEALPRVLRIHNDTPNDTGMTPYQILFGRDRNEAGIPYAAPNEAEDAKSFFKRMQKIDEKVAKVFSERHQQVADLYNKDKRDMQPFKPGDIVWVLRPPSMGGHKMETWWLGPAKVTQRVGKTSYKVLIKPNVEWDCHREWMKPYIPDQVMGTGVPLFYHQGTTKSSGLRDVHDPVKQILKHRKVGGKLQFLTRWKGAAPHEDSWEDADNFIGGLPDAWLEYLFNHELYPDLWKMIYHFDM